MSRFIVTSGSDFRPFSYDELLKPVQSSAEAHSAAADAYDQLSMETAALGNYISSEEGSGDVRARAMYDNYVQKLQNFQNNLWENGVTAATRRDMSAARSAYAQDITRLQKAIQDRQERSKEYWDARHKNPDLIMGFDPRNGGLDNYLDNSEYGRDWYSYSGNQFASEVGAEAKARAAELLDSYAGKSGIPGYLEYIQKNGFTNAQVNEAGLLAQNILSGRGRIEDAGDPASALLASVLISRLQATGANPGAGGNLSPEEFGRLFNYGMLGLSQGVGEINQKLIDDKIFDQQQKIALANYQNGLKQLLKNAGDSSGDGVHRELVERPIQSAEADKVLAKTNKIFDDDTYADGATVRLNLPNGGGRVIHNSDEARQLFQTERSNKFYDATGIDVRVPASDWLHTGKSKQLGEYKGVPLMAERAGALQIIKHKNIKPGDVVVKKKVNGKWEYDALMTENYNRAKFEYDNWMKDLRASNPHLNLDTIGLTPDEAKKLRKQYDIPAGVSDFDLRTAIESKVDLGNRLGVPVINGPEDNDIRERFANNVNGFYSNTRGKRDWKTIEQGFYRVGSGNSGVDGVNAAKDGLDKVFAVDKNGAIDPKSIYSVYIMPQDIKNGKTKVRVETSKGTFITDISLLGTDIDGSMNSAVTQILETMMLPLNNNVVSVLDANSDVGNGWDAFIYDALYGYADIPAIQKPEGGYRVATAQEVARDPRLQRVLLNGINEYLKDAIAYGIDPNTLHPRQHVSYTSSKAEGLTE